MECVMCHAQYGKGKGFHGERYKTVHFCSQDCYEEYIAMKSAPKAPVNYKPAQNTTRRKFTDYVQKLTNDEANWAYLMKQAKDIQEEYEVDWQEMYMTLKYAHEYENIEWDMRYGLYQFFPKYIKTMKDFAEKIKAYKENIPNIEEELYIVAKKKDKREKEVEF